MQLASASKKRAPSSPALLMPQKSLFSSFLQRLRTGKSREVSVYSKVTVHKTKTVFLKLAACIKDSAKGVSPENENNVFLHI